MLNVAGHKNLLKEAQRLIENGWQNFIDVLYEAFIHLKSPATYKEVVGGKGLFIILYMGIAVALYGINAVLAVCAVSLLYACFNRDDTIAEKVSMVLANFASAVIATALWLFLP
jgi:hypothetical protein